MFGALTIEVVEVGTEIEHEGETLTVTETEMVQRNGVVYATQAQYDKIKERANKRSAQ